MGGGVWRWVFWWGFVWGVLKMAKRKLRWKERRGVRRVEGKGEPVISGPTVDCVLLPKCVCGFAHCVGLETCFSRNVFKTYWEFMHQPGFFAPQTKNLTESPREVKAKRHIRGA